MQRVRFVQHFSPYNVEEVASFSPEQAALFVKRGIATLVIDTPAVIKDVPVIETTAAGETGATAAPAGEIDDEDLESPTKGRGKGKKP